MYRYWLLAVVEVCLLLQTIDPCACQKKEIIASKEDWLRPYSNKHYDLKRNHRYVRSCQPVIHGNVTHETLKPAGIKFLDNFEVNYFSREIVHSDKRKEIISGHISFISNPLKTFSILEPLHAGSCNPWFAPRGKVAVSARRKKCVIASNAGYFHTGSGGCIGNIYSDGKLVQTAEGIQNANFGIRRDGSLVTGYLSEEDVRSSTNPFVQLVSGVGWLLRNGEDYTNISKLSECADSEETGSIERFFGVVSARTAVGHDRYGRMVVVHVDGKTDKKGVSLYTFAELLKSFNVVNAINLDGGGSTTFVVNDTVTNYPSDQCGKSFVCPRKVSTILCFHEPECAPSANCSGNGLCTMGKCKCHPGWSGSSCSDRIVEEKEIDPMLSQWNTKQSENSLGASFMWSIGLAALFATSLIGNVCLANLYLATSWREKRMLRTKDDLQRLLNAENEDL